MSWASNALIRGAMSVEARGITWTSCHISRAPVLFLKAWRARQISTLTPNPCSTTSPQYTLSATRRSLTTHAAAAATSKKSEQIKVSKETKEFWDTVLEGVDKPTAKKLIPLLDTSLVLGISPEAKKQGKTPIPLYTYFVDTKKQHPTKVLLVRVGEFYETSGIDAVLLVQYAGLNPMGTGDPPRAGCPTQNLRRTIQDLVEGAGLSVVVCEEAPVAYNWGRMRTTQKERYVAAVVTPASPHFVHGLIDEDTDFQLDSAPPLLGVSPTVGGYSLIEVDAELRSVMVTEGLTEEAVCARLHEGGLAPPLYVHVPATPSDTRLTEATPETAWERRVGAIFRNQVGLVVRYSEPDAVKGMLDNVRHQLGLSVNEPFTIKTSSAKDRPRPIYYSTAANLGLHKTRGVPSLLDFVMSPGAPLASRRWMNKLLLLPPPPKTALSIQKVCTYLKELEEPVPDFPVMSPANVVLKLRTRQANDTFFREIAGLCRAVEQACEIPALIGLTEALLSVAESETGISIRRADVQTACREVLAEIHEAIHHDETIGTGSTYGKFQLYLFSFSYNKNNESSYSDTLLRMIHSNEDYKGKIKPERIPEVFQRVENARENLRQTIDTVYKSLQDLKPDDPSSTKSKANFYLYYDVANNSVWFKAPAFSKSRLGTIGVYHPPDRNGKFENKGAYSTRELEAALDEYRQACSDASNAVREELRALAKRLQPWSSQLVCASVFAVIAAALDCHVREAARVGWILPTLAYSDNTQPNPSKNSNGSSLKNGVSELPAGASSSNTSLNVQDVWPYWLNGYDRKTVRNSFSMDSMFLLTGPNMAGKSTLLRTLCAVTLLGACGLHVPAASATLPYIDAFIMRNFSADSPLEGRSSFAVEMTEMRYLLDDVTSSSLVLIDELGKGTEVKAGAALAGAMLERLDSVGCKGIFATHLHVLLDLELQIPNTTNMAMETCIDENSRLLVGGDVSSTMKKVRLRPTWKMIPGVSTESLALEVASDSGIDQGIIDRAAHLFERAAILTGGASSSSSSLSSSDDDENDIEADTDDDGFLSSQHGGGGVDNALSDTEEEQEDKINDARYVLESARTLLQTTASSLVKSPLEAFTIRPGFKPPSRTVGASCVYIARRKDGWYYVGSTDSLLDRVNTHRKKGSQVSDPQAEFVYVALLGVQGAGSMARSVEAAVIKSMQVEGFPLLSAADAKRRHRPNMSSTSASE